MKTKTKKLKAKSKRSTARMQEDTDNFHILQGLTRGFFMWVLPSGNERQIYEAFNYIYDSFFSLNVEETLFISFIHFSIDDGLIQREDVDKMMLALINNDQDEDTIGWLSYCFREMDDRMKSAL